MLVAFSTVTMAKSKEVKILKSKSLKNSYFMFDCLSAAQTSFTMMVANGVERSCAREIMEAAYWVCMNKASIAAE